MALQWSVVILDRVSLGGLERQQDMVKIGGIDMERSSFHPTTSPKPATSRMYLSFPIATPDLFITEMMEVWAGWRDDVTNFWSEVDPDGNPFLPFGGYITRIESETVYGGEKIFECSVSDYGILLTKTDVKGWPFFLTHVPIAGAAGTYERVGMPAGKTVMDWLIGGDGSQDYDGLLRKHLGNGVRFDGVDPIFDTIQFDSDTIPGTIIAVPGAGAVQGYFGGANCSLDSVCRVIADATLFTYSKNYIGPDLIVGYWMSARIGSDPTRVVPQFCFKNIADIVSTPDAIIATDADLAAGEIQMLTPHKHERDATEIRTRVNLFGVGGDIGSYDSQHPNPPLVFASYYLDDHANHYPTTYQTEPGWGGGCLFDERLHRIDTANLLARYVENRVWGARGSIEFYIDRPMVAGQRVRVRDTNEAINQVYIVTEAEGPDNRGLWRIRVGFTQQTVSDLIKGGLADVLLTQEDLYFKSGAWISRVNPTTGPQNPIMANPLVGSQNHITAPTAFNPALRIQSTLFIDNAQSTPMSGSYFANSLEVLPPAKGTDPITPWPSAGTWTSHLDARPHPNCFHIGAYTVDGLYPITIAVYEVVLDTITMKGPGSFHILKNGTEYSGPFTAAGDGEIKIPSPLTLLPGRPAGTGFLPPDDISIQIAGTSPTVPTYIVLWEKFPYAAPVS